MIESVLLQGAPSFGATQCLLGPLERFNFVFGPNGTGKTTISKVLNDPSVFAGPSVQLSQGSPDVEAAVYNRDYVARTLQEADRLPGIFTIDDEDPDARAEYNNLVLPGGEIERLESELAAHNGTIGHLEAQQTRIKATFLDAAWAARDSVPTELEPMFEGTRGSREVFYAKLIAVPKAEPEQADALIREAKSAFDPEASSVEEFRLIPGAGVSADDAVPLLLVPIVGSGDVSLAELVRKLDNTDWLRTGRDYLELSEGLCPFCQQTLPGDFLRHLAELFDAEYEAQLEEVRSLAAAWNADALTVQSSLDELALADEAFIDASAMRETSAKVREVFRSNSAAFAAKLGVPSGVEVFQDPRTVITDANRLVVAANGQIAAHNARIAARASARKVLVDKCWTHFVWSRLASESGAYHGASIATAQRLEELRAPAAVVLEQLNSARQRASVLESGLKSSRAAIEKVNKLLKRVGFTSFSLAASPDIRDGYCLVRSDGTTVEDTLSEGERTFIAFLYYFGQLQSKHVSPDARQLLAVIDDPISSLDSDVMFAVSAMVRDVTTMLHKDDGRLKQLILLTHNAQFHLEVTYPRKHDENAGLIGGRQFFVLARDSAGATRIVPHLKKNPVQPTYRRLWDEVRIASFESAPMTIGLENTMRRILENYFTILGSTRNLNDLFGKFDGDEASACKSLLSWLHSGSHSWIDDLEYSPSNIARSTYLGVFEKVFEIEDQLGHYNMMMGIAGTAAEQVPAAS